MLLNENETYIFNPAYVMKNDSRRVVIYSGLEKNHLSARSWESFVHPLHAKIFSFFTFNRSLNANIILLSEYLNHDKEKIKKIISPFIENPLSVFTKYNDDKVFFPKNVIINRSQIKGEVDYLNLMPEQFNCRQIDVKSRRHFSAPSLLTIMLNNRCVTDCVYCYADTKTKTRKPLSTARILGLIEEAHTMQVRAVNLMGGEIFLHPDWFIILKKLVDLNMSPEYISTKLPINDRIIEDIKKTGYNNPLQISLDSVSPTLLKQTLSVKDGYISKIMEGIELIDKSELKYRIASVLTTYNTNNEKIKDLFGFISRLKNIRDWRITPAVNSIRIEYSHFSKLKPTKEEIESLYQFIENNIIPVVDYPILLNRAVLNRDFHYCKTGSNDFKGERCSALSNHLFILPDGKVTICEQLYWNPKFLIGDVTANSISEVWNSSDAIKLITLKRDDIQETSSCKKCQLFDECFSSNNRCWVDIIKAYGKENWDYPDLRCAYAPPMINNLGFEEI